MTELAITGCAGSSTSGGISVVSDHVNLGSFRGTELKDSKGLLEGTGKGMRHIKVGEVADLLEEEFADLVKQAAALNPKK